MNDDEKEIQSSRFQEAINEYLDYKFWCIDNGIDESDVARVKYYRDNLINDLLNDD